MRVIVFSKMLMYEKHVNHWRKRTRVWEREREKREWERERHQKKRIEEGVGLALNMPTVESWEEREKERERGEREREKKKEKERNIREKREKEKRNSANGSVATLGFCGLVWSSTDTKIEASTKSSGCENSNKRKADNIFY